MKSESKRARAPGVLVRPFLVIVGAWAAVAMLLAAQSPQAARGEGVGVQVGAFQRAEGAAGLAGELAQGGYLTRTIQSSSLHRVVVGPFPTQAAAETALSELKLLGYDGYVRNDVAFSVAPAGTKSEGRASQPTDRVTLQALDSPAGPVDTPAREIAEVLPATEAAAPTGLPPLADQEQGVMPAFHSRTPEPPASPPYESHERAGNPDQEAPLTANVPPASPEGGGQVSGDLQTAAEDKVPDKSPQLEQPPAELVSAAEPAAGSLPDRSEQEPSPALDLSPNTTSTQAGSAMIAESPQTGNETALDLEPRDLKEPPGAKAVEPAPAASPLQHIRQEDISQTTAAEVVPVAGALDEAELAQALPATPSHELPAEPSAAPVPDSTSTAGQTESIAVLPSADGKPKLAIKILQGNELVHTVGQRAARDPVVQVVDENDRPVAGAVVVFDLPARGASGTFANGAKSVTVLTGQDGTAAATGVTANSAQGQYAMQVTASHQGQTASTAVAQVNAAAGGGLSAAATAGIVAGIAGGAAVALVVVKNSIENRVRQEVAARNPPSVITTVAPGPSVVGAP